jgi:very-short-patch-repair endonuclease
LAAGISRSAWYRLHDKGVLVALQPGWSAIGGLRAPSNQHVAAAVGAASRSALASHRSAAQLWGVDLPHDGPIDVTVPDRPRRPKLDGVLIHRPIDRLDLGPVRRDGIPTTNPLRTVLDIGAVSDLDRTAAVVDHFIIGRSFGLATLRRAVERHSRRGRNGIGALRMLLDELRLGDKPPDSVLEPAMASLLEAHNLPGAVFHHVVSTSGGRFELDFAYVPSRVDIEVDGWASHGSRRAFAADRARDAYLVGAGWVVLRFTWFQVTRRPAWVAARVADALRQRTSR